MKFGFIAGQVEDYQNIFKLNCKPLSFTSNKGNLKNKRKSGYGLPASFSA